MICVTPQLVCMIQSRETYPCANASSFWPTSRGVHHGMYWCTYVPAARARKLIPRTARHWSLQLPTSITVNANADIYAHNDASMLYCNSSPHSIFLLKKNTRRPIRSHWSLKMKERKPIVRFRIWKSVFSSQPPVSELCDDGFLTSTMQFQTEHARATVLWLPRVKFLKKHNFIFKVLNID